MSELSQTAAPGFTGLRVQFTHEQNYDSPIERVFPLLCPVREAEYLSRWSCDIVYLSSGLIEPGGVFTTCFPTDGEGRDVWVVSRYEPRAIIQFVRVNARRCMIYTITALPGEKGQTRLHWQQVVTGLTPEGNAYVGRLRQRDFTLMLSDMERRLQYFLDTGRMLAE